ncbi:hypothetical protein QOM21_36430 [Streptomyces sp. Pv4-95]|uniref:hypothetical protein n=1 Tax=Streptomyces sp. Pv4-95 TaxID=3049543 RepID=UPI0038917FCA
MGKAPLRRLAAVTGVLVAAAALPLVATAPAHADGFDCQQIVAKAGYKVGKKVYRACSTGEEPPAGPAVCTVQLQWLGVKQSVAMRACDAAAR